MDEQKHCYQNHIQDPKAKTLFHEIQLIITKEKGLHQRYHTWAIWGSHKEPVIQTCFPVPDDKLVLSGWYREFAFQQQFPDEELVHRWLLWRLWDKFCSLDALIPGASVDPLCTSGVDEEGHLGFRTRKSSVSFLLHLIIQLVWMGISILANLIQDCRVFMCLSFGPLGSGRCTAEALEVQWVRTPPPQLNIPIRAESSTVDWPRRRSRRTQCLRRQALGSLPIEQAKVKIG